MSIKLFYFEYGFYIKNLDPLSNYIIPNGNNFKVHTQIITNNNKPHNSHMYSWNWQYVVGLIDNIASLLGCNVAKTLTNIESSEAVKIAEKVSYSYMAIKIGKQQIYGE